MRVLVDGTSLLLRSAGIKNYIYYWLQHLRLQSGPGEQIDAFPFLDRLGPLTHEKPVLSALSAYPRLALLYFVNVRWNPAFDWIASRYDIVHLSNQVRNPTRRATLTATVYDLTCWLLPELHTPANVRAETNFADNVLRRASRLIAISGNTRHDAAQVLRIPEERMEVIYPGVPDAFFQASPGVSARPYILYVGAVEPRKNIDRLLDAWEMLSPEDYDLVVAGAAGWASRKTFARLQSGIRGVQYRGYVPESELPALTAGAAAFIYPSLYEGFGFPVAQAMAAGVPVITSGVSCLPEVAGEGALYVDPRSPGEIRDAIQRLMTSPSLRARLSAQGRERALQYRWEENARKSLEFFRSVG